MAINRMEIKNFLVFKEEFSIDFCPGINVVIGSNGTGKTTLLKMMYAPHTWNKEFQIVQNIKSDVSTIVVNDTIMVGRYFYNIHLNHNVENENWMTSEIKYYSSEVSSEPFFHIKYSANLSKAVFGGKFENIIANPSACQNEIRRMQKFISSIKSAVYIPVAEMLSHSKGFLELNAKYELPFDKTQIDILMNAGLPVTREVSSLCAALLEKIGRIIDGEVLYEDGKYYIVKNSGLRIDFSLEASGYQKFALLWKLLRNGLIEHGSVLFWDEPEAGINPELMPVLVDILLELQRNGVQIFIATHSEILASYFDVNRKDGDSVFFYSLKLDENKYIKADKSDRFDLLEPNNLIAEPIKLYEKELERMSGNA